MTWLLRTTLIIFEIVFQFVKAAEIAIPLSRMEQVDEELEENLVGFMEKTTMGKNLGRVWLSPFRIKMLLPLVAIKIELKKVKFYTVDDDAGDDKKKKKK